MNALVTLLPADRPARAAASRPPLVGRSDPEADGRWPALRAELARLREAGRRSVRIVDAGCGDGALLLHAVRHASAIGFVAIEGRGIDGAPAPIARARHAAARLRDPAIGIRFDVAEVGEALEEEADFPADIVLWRPVGSGIEVHAAGRIVIRGERR